MNRNLPCPAFEGSGWDDNHISWFKDTPAAQEWIAIFREIIAILEDSDFDVATLTTHNPGMIVYEDDHPLVAKSTYY